MIKIIATCLLGSVLITAVTTLPQSQAHEGHDGHDHGGTFASTQESPQQIRPTDSTNDVITSPPPFETLDSKSPPLLAPPPTTPSDQNPGRHDSVNRNSIQPPQRPLDRFGQSNPNTDFYNVPRLNSEDEHSHSRDTADSFDQFPRDSFRSQSRDFDNFSPQETFPARPRFSQSTSDCDSELYRGCPSNHYTCGYDQAEARSTYTSTPRCNLADGNYQYSYSPRIDFDSTDYRQYRDDFHCPGAIGSCDSFAPQFNY